MGRITTVLEDEAVFKYVTSQIGNLNDFIIAGDDGTSLKANDLFIAFTPVENNPKTKGYAEIISKKKRNVVRTKKIFVIPNFIVSSP